MKDSTKQILAVFLSSFIVGIISGLLQDKVSPEIYFVIFVIALIIMFFVVKKFTPKSYKNDELLRKLSIMNDAVGGRAAIVTILILAFAEFHFNFSLTAYFGLDDIYLLGFIFIAMSTAAIISHIYYSNNPDKLP